ncbi:Dot/Icm T4SS effector CetCb6 [Coxiella burnetii]|uniref:Dot/Icm T4SS effector CetCb6 n=1 Tax=Coxiella burnetii TaxID=777 RepID=UPI000CCBD8B1|nr:Dot/Icm T4SS effector CetCb6 [Coxiella burnetii]PNT88485.1 ankyrin repeat domain-containing protein [Coxiella burnetii]
MTRQINFFKPSFEACEIACQNGDLENIKKNEEFLFSGDFFQKPINKFLAYKHFGVYRHLMGSGDQFKKLAMEHLIGCGKFMFDEYENFVELIDVFPELATQPAILQQATYSIQDKPRGQSKPDIVDKIFEIIDDQFSKRGAIDRKEYLESIVKILKQPFYLGLFWRECSALRFLVSAGKLNILKQLYEWCASLNLLVEWTTACQQKIYELNLAHIAAQNSQLETLKWLLSTVENLDVFADIHGQTLLRVSLHSYIDDPTLKYLLQLDQKRPFQEEKSEEFINRDAPLKSLLHILPQLRGSEPSNEELEQAIIFLENGADVNCQFGELGFLKSTLKDLSVAKDKDSQYWGNAAYCRALVSMNSTSYRDIDNKEFNDWLKAAAIKYRNTKACITLIKRLMNATQSTPSSEEETKSLVAETSAGENPLWEAFKILCHNTDGRPQDYLPMEIGVAICVKNVPRNTDTYFDNLIQKFIFSPKHPHDFPSLKLAEDYFDLRSEVIIRYRNRNWRVEFDSFCEFLTIVSKFFVTGEEQASCALFHFLKYFYSPVEFETLMTEEGKNPFATIVAIHQQFDPQLVKTLDPLSAGIYFMTHLALNGFSIANDKTRAIRESETTSLDVAEIELPTQDYQSHLFDVVQPLVDNYNKSGDEDQQKISGVLQALLLQYAYPELNDIKEVLKVPEWEKGIKQALEIIYKKEQAISAKVYLEYLKQSPQSSLASKLTTFQPQPNRKEEKKEKLTEGSVPPGLK